LAYAIRRILARDGGRSVKRRLIPKCISFLKNEGSKDDRMVKATDRVYAENTENNTGGKTLNVYGGNLFFCANL
jgi:hypothetical protein